MTHCVISNLKWTEIISKHLKLYACEIFKKKATVFKHFILTRKMKTELINFLTCQESDIFF
jgi:hypothetical protein